MRCVTVRTPEATAGGILRDDDSIVALPSLGHSSVLELIQAGPDAWDAGAADNHPAEWHLDEVDLAAPIPVPPRNVFCVGLNYQDHYDEGDDRGLPEDLPLPVFFTKPWTTLIGHGDDIVVDPDVTAMADWEAEIAVVIGVEGSDIEPERAWDHLFGLSLANDVTARDVQRAHGQWFKGKALDTFCPMGPFLRTLASIDDVDRIAFSLTVNGIEKQATAVERMIHDIPRIVSQLSHSMRLLPGDIILTGTPSGVGFWREPKEFLANGDVVEMAGTGLGVLRNQVVFKKSK